MMILLTAFLTAWMSLAALQDKAPVPDAAAMKPKEKLVRNVFADEYAKTSAADKTALARKLLAQGIETKDDIVCRFVLFREARDLAAQVGDLAIVLSAIDETDKSFQIDPMEMKNAALSTIAKTAKDPDLCRNLATAFLKVAEEEFARDDCDGAAKAAASAASIARKSKDIALTTRAEARSREYADIKARGDAVKAAREKLAATPDDPAANLVVGRFLCLIRANWEAGLTYLSKGSDPALKVLADRELAAPTETAAQMSLGDEWWGQGEKETGIARDNLRRHAAEWYRKCVGELAGLNKTRIEKLLREAAATGAAPDEWVDFTDPKLFGLTGDPGDAIDVTAEAGRQKGRILGNFPEGEFDGVSARVRFDPKNCLLAALGFEDRRSFVGIDTEKSSLQAYAQEESGAKLLSEKGCPRKQEYVLTVVIEGGEYVYSLDGEVQFKVKTSLDRFTYLCLTVESGTATFDQIRLRRKK